jgi:hypothetical protein
MPHVEDMDRNYFEVHREPISWLTDSIAWGPKSYLHRILEIMEHLNGVGGSPCTWDNPHMALRLLQF